MPADTDWRIPVWFVRLVSAVLTLAVPWASWVTVQLVTIGVRVDQAVESRQEIQRVSERLADHLASPDSHSGLTRDFTRRLDHHQTRLDRLEAAR
jgi:hypothetical protein